jgi:hypothetical protein
VLSIIFIKKNENHENSPVLFFCFTAITFIGSSIARAQEWSEKQKEIWSVVEKSWSDWKSGNATDVLATALPLET